MGRGAWLLLGAILVLHVLLRVPHLGHLLAWDEAMNLLSVRSHAAGVNNEYAYWFSRHPPVYTAALSWLMPFSSSFAVHAAGFSLAVSAGVLAMLFAVMRVACGTRAALFAGACYALMPGAIFYDTWVKQDGLVALTGLGAILCWLLRRPVPSGLLLGLCFLLKANAIFYAAAVFMLWLVERPRQWRGLAIVAAGPAVLAGWWYLFRGTDLGHQFAFVTGIEVREVEEWSKPWWYFFAKLRLDLGWPGVIAAVAGLAVVVGRVAGVAGPARGLAFWPLAVLLPGYAIITLMHGKTPWLNIALLPAWAALQGTACDWLWRLPLPGRFGRRGLLSFAALAVLAAALVRFDYARFMQRQDLGMWRGSNASRSAAAVLARLAVPGQRILVTPMWYWTEEQAATCPIFLCYLDSLGRHAGLELFAAANSIAAPEFVEIVRAHRIDFALVAPPPGDGERRLLRPLVDEFHLAPIVPDGNMNCIFDVRPLHQ